MGPRDFDAQTDEAVGKGHTFYKQPRGNGGCVPTARAEPSKYWVRGSRFLIHMEGLGVELGRELLHASQVHDRTPGVAETLTNGEVVEVEGVGHGRQQNPTLA